MLEKLPELKEEFGLKKYIEVSLFWFYASVEFDSFTYSTPELHLHLQVNSTEGEQVVEFLVVCLHFSKSN